jgi:hypothetical protein
MPNDAVGAVWADLKAGAAALAFIGINHSDIALGGVDVTGSCRTFLHTYGFGTLPAGEGLNVIGISTENGSGNLYSGQRDAGRPFVYKGTCHHTALASDAAFAVKSQKSLGLCENFL